MPDELDDARFRWLFDYWRQRRRDGRLPGRPDIDPLDFPHLLGRIYLIEVVRSDGALRFRFRLWGTKISGLFRHEHTGHWLEDIAAPGTLGELEHMLTTCVEQRRPRFWRREIPGGTLGFMTTRRMLLPLAADGETVDMLFGLILEEKPALSR